VLQTHTRNTQYLPLSHGNSGYANAPQCNVKRTLSALCYIEKSLCRFLKYPYSDDEQRYLTNDIDIFRVLLCAFLLYLSQIRNSKYSTDYFHVCIVHFDCIININYSTDVLLRPTNFALRIFCTASIIFFYVSGFPDCAMPRLVHSHTHFRMYMYYLFLYWRLKEIVLGEQGVWLAGS
jgi:hypothetical protein